MGGFEEGADVKPTSERLFDHLVGTSEKGGRD